MIRKKTVLVLGAGASAPYGFPSGYNLMKDIWTGLELREPLGLPLNTELYDHLLDGGCTDDSIEEFRLALFGSGQQSVDAFLEHRSDLIPIGKLAIAASLIPCEKPREVIRQQDNEAWYEHLLGSMGSSERQFSENELSIVTFNYDRSLEFFLHTSLINSYRMSESRALELLKTIHITHVYGQLGDYPGGRAFEPSLSVESLRTAVDGIRIMHEGQNHQDHLRSAHARIAAAEVVVFLGFGYHSINLGRLELSRPRTSVLPRHIYGTTYHLKDAQRNRVHQLIGGDKNNLGHYNEGCLSFLKSMLHLEESS